MNNPLKKQERLDYLVEQGEDHWRKYLPKKWRKLQKEGRAQVALREAAKLTLKDLDDFEDQGIPDNQAWEVVRGRYLLLDPAEHGETVDEDLPYEGMDPDHYERMKAVEDAQRIPELEDEEPELPVQTTE